MSVRLRNLIRRLQTLEKRWTDEAKSFHSIGRTAYRRGDMSGKEYMQSAAVWRSCARELKKARK